MLVLTRKLGESIIIGDNIKVVVLGIYGREVRLGIDAPIKVEVHREEIYNTIQKEKNSGKVKKESIFVRAISTMVEWFHFVGPKTPPKR